MRTAATASVAIVAIFLCLAGQTVAHPSHWHGHVAHHQDRHTHHLVGYDFDKVVNEELVSIDPADSIPNHEGFPGLPKLDLAGSKAPGLLAPVAEETAGLQQQPGGVSSIRGLHTPTGCPAWMAEYAAFHKQQRGQPQARYLVFSIKHGSSGLGDRLRAMMYVTRLAASSQRVVLFTWRQDPVEPQAYLPPAGDIDFTLNGIAGYQNRSSKGGLKVSGLQLEMFTWKAPQKALAEAVQAGALLNMTEHQFITVYTNEKAEAPCHNCPPLLHPLEIDKHNSSSSSNSSSDSSGSRAGSRTDGRPSSPIACLFRFLFKPSDNLQKAVDQQLLQLFGPASLAPDFKYIAAHLRLGGLGHEGALRAGRGTGRGDLADLIAAISCARRLGQHAGVDIDRVPVLLITDNHELRSFVLAGELAHAITPNLLPTHLARLTQDEKAGGAAALSTFIDLGLLARAACLVVSDSGFSNAAWMLGGGHGCVAMLQKGGGSTCGQELPSVAAALLH